MTTSTLRTTGTAALILLALALPMAGTSSLASYHDDPGGEGVEGVAEAHLDSASVHVDITDLQPFDPASLTIQSGTEVVWHNHGFLPHTVTLVAGIGLGDDSFDRTVYATDDPNTPEDETTTSHTFTDRGVYYIRCEINAFHEATMHQVIEVV